MKSRKAATDNELEYRRLPNDARREEDPEPWYKRWCKCTRLQVGLLLCLTFDIDPEDPLGSYVAFPGCVEIAYDGNSHHELWKRELFEQMPDVCACLKSAVEEGTFTETEYNSVDVKRRFIWARNLGLEAPKSFWALNADASKTKTQLNDIQKAYDAIRNQTGKAPSQRAVTDNHAECGMIIST